ncbi:hypothetical protein DXG01_011396 [Tephrocybe rancida]|nr:hypothetical protein DXG01_011396 [Tephrocybe rancida]
MSLLDGKLSALGVSSGTKAATTTGPAPTATGSVAEKGTEIKPRIVYNGGYSGTEIKLRIANGGAGQSGLIGAWADAFIKYSVEQLDLAPFLVGWCLGDTTESLTFLANGSVDVAVTYNAAAEAQSENSLAAAQRVYGFRDHFLLVGPPSNPANLSPSNDDIHTMFNKIVSIGNADVLDPPQEREPVRFLSRFDKSATNIKESEIFITIGQVPWGLAYSKWYHQYPRFPLPALEAASLLSEYTLTDRGTWLSSPASVTGNLVIFKAGSDDSSDPLLNPAHVLRGTKATNPDIAKSFMTWVIAKDGGQKVVAEFKKEGKVLYSVAPDAAATVPM